MILADVAHETGPRRQDLRLARGHDHQLRVDRAASVTETRGFIRYLMSRRADLRLVLGLIAVAHHIVLIANQFDLISEQLRNIDVAAVLDRSGTAASLSAMAHLAGSQLLAR